MKKLFLIVFICISGFCSAEETTFEKARKWKAKEIKKQEDKKKEARIKKFKEDEKLLRLFILEVKNMRKMIEIIKEEENEKYTKIQKEYENKLEEIRQKYNTVIEITENENKKNELKLKREKEVEKYILENGEKHYEKIIIILDYLQKKYKIQDKLIASQFGLWLENKYEEQVEKTNKKRRELSDKVDCEASRLYKLKRKYENKLEEIKMIKEFIKNTNTLKK